MTTRNAALLPAMLALLAPTTLLAAQSIDERRAMPAEGTVTVINVAGDITITTWDREEVHLTGQLGAESELDISESGQGVRIEVRPRNGKGYNRHYEESDLILSVPATAEISATGVSSDINISGAAGAGITAETVSGDVDVRAQAGRVDLKSVSGDVRFEGASLRTSAESVSGDIELSGAEGELTVSVVSGDVELRGGSFERGRFEAVSGTLDLVLEIRSGGSVNVQSMSGDVNVALPPDQAVEIRAQTFSGDIRSRFGSPQKPEHGPGTRLEHTAAGGGASLRLESFSGDVEISEQ